MVLSCRLTPTGICLHILRVVLQIFTLGFVVINLLRISEFMEA